MHKKENIIVIGASAGGVSVISELLSKLPADLDASVFVVLHMSKSSNDEIVLNSLGKKCPLVCTIPYKEETIKKGHVYIARPDHHLLIKKGKVLTTHWAHENKWRPSIDVLFRSCAAAYGSDAIGVILTGLLDDGTAGMDAIKRSGGICIVQEPADAKYGSMPLNVLNNVEVDYRVPADDIPYILTDLLAKQKHEFSEAPEDIKFEAELTEKMESAIDNLPKIGVHSNFTCPDCGGGLWEMKHGVPRRFRCHTGHVYGEKSLLQKQNEDLEDNIWICIRMLEEQRNFLLQQNDKDVKNTQEGLPADYKARAHELQSHIERLKVILLALDER